MVNDPACPYPVFFFARGVSYCQESLYRVHIGVQSPVIIQYCKLCIPGITGKTLFLIPETEIIEFQGILQKFLRSRPSCQKGRCSCQDYKGMGITLFIWEDLVICCKACIPASVACIVKFSPEAFKPCIRQFLAARMAQEGADAVYMGHSGSDPCLPASILPGCSVISQIIGASSRRRKSVAEIQQILPDLLLKFSVFLCADLIFFL